MIVSGVTRNRLNEIKTYDKNNPFQVGVNGVTNILTDTDGNPERIEYTINGVGYVTIITDPTIPLETTKTNKEYYDIDRNMTTTYTVDVAPIETVDNNILKEEVLMGVVFPPKIEEEIFIERERLSVFEPHSRLGEIKTLDQLEEYRNGYYNIQNLNT